MIGDAPIVDLPQAVRGLVEARTGDAVFVVAPDFGIVHWNEQAEFLTRIGAEEAAGKRCCEVVLEEKEGGTPFCSYGCSVMKLAQAGRPVASYDMRLTAPSGPERWVNVSILSVDSAEGPYLVHLLRDAQGRHGRGLSTIPAVVDAVREAWIPASSASGETPAWPVLVQRQAHPECIG